MEMRSGKTTSSASFQRPHEQESHDAPTEPATPPLQIPELSPQVKASEALRMLGRRRLLFDCIAIAAANLISIDSFSASIVSRVNCCSVVITVSQSRSDIRRK